MTLDEQIACVCREIAMRALVYPRWVQNGRMTLKQADHEQTAMECVLQTLLSLKETLDSRAEGKLS